MNYNEYYEILRKRQEELYIQYPKTISSHRPDHYYWSLFTDKRIKYGYVIAGNGSRAFGEENGFIVEAYIANNELYNYLKSNKELIENEFGNVQIIWQDRDSTVDTNRTNRIYAKKIANIEDKNLWKESIDWQINTMLKFLEVIPNYQNEKNIKKEIMKKEKLNTKNIILYGVPGVGKTYSYKRLVSLIEQGKNEKEIFDTICKNEITNDKYNNTFETIKNDNRLEFITFHQSYSYEDFIEGFKPNGNGGINLEDGLFKTFCKKAKENQEQNYYLIIDEINRGNISKIFGELITLVEEDKRDKYEVTLPYSKDKFSIPSNLYIISTMNSSDKSIASIDIALRRRFTFLKMIPNIDLVKNANALQLMKELNQYIENHLSKDFLLGHSYFMKIENDSDLEFVKEYKIKPRLEEYFFADDKSADEIIKLAEKEYEERKITLY